MHKGGQSRSFLVKFRGRVLVLCFNFPAHSESSDLLTKNLDGYKGARISSLTQVASKVGIFCNGNVAFGYSWQLM